MKPKIKTFAAATAVCLWLSLTACKGEKPVERPFGKPLSPPTAPPPPSADPGAAGGDLARTLSAPPDALLTRVDALRGQLAKAKKPVGVQLALGNLFYENRRYLDAIESYRAALLAADQSERTLLEQSARSRGKSGQAMLDEIALARVHRANAFFLVGNAQRAIDEHRATLTRYPNQPDALFYLGALTLETSAEPSDRASAAQAWRHFLEVASSDDPRRGIIKEKLDKLSAPLPLSPSTSALVPTPGPLNTGAAEAIANTDISDPSFIPAAERQVAEGESLIDQGKLGEARDRLRGLLPLFMTKAPDSPLFPRILAGMGQIYVGMGNVEMGRRLAKLALEKDPHSKRAQTVLGSSTH